MSNAGPWEVFRDWLLQAIYIIVIWPCLLTGTLNESKVLYLHEGCFTGQKDSCHTSKKAGIRCYKCLKIQSVCLQVRIIGHVFVQSKERVGHKIWEYSPLVGRRVFEYTYSSKGGVFSSSAHEGFANNALNVNSMNANPQFRRKANSSLQYSHSPQQLPTISRQ